MREQIGYWSSSNDPRTLVDPSWPLRERVRLATYLRRGEVLNYWLGFSHCRFDCGIPPQCTGTKDLGDECYIWPEGLPHYIEEHAVRLPAEFLAHVAPRLPWLWPWWRLGLWWRRRQVARASARQRQADEDRRDQAQREALHTAAWERDDERVRALLAAGYAVDGRSEYGLTPLARARSLAVTRLLLDAGAEVDPQPPGYITPLLQAASDDDGERMELLLARGADIRGLDKFGRSVLDYCKPARIEWLLEHGADPKLGA
ncbi:MAG: ankyrin repeat domain-containing protein, partial [Myxococcales bacterium]|nr:ankyrin repeat domain-containing protein [Myxococcales bacterium]